MILIIGVRFRKSGKIYYFDPLDFLIEKGDHVIVETARGVEYGTVVLAPREITDDKVVQPLKPVIRLATTEDDQIALSNEEREKEAFQICLEKIRKHELEMKLIDSEYTFDRNKLLFYFTADGRIDFRELVKDLASVFHTRIELRQIGVRDETKLIGGIAICGRPLCCHSFLSEFAPVSIKMAKEQNLSLNPSKISGVCGRLMCCLKNEQEAYEHLNRNLPHVGGTVSTPDGYQGEVQSVSVLRQLVKVVISNDNDEREVREYHVNDLTFDSKVRSNGSAATALPDEALDEVALQELEELVKEDDTASIDKTEKPNNRKKNRNRNFKDNRDKDSRDNRKHQKNYDNRKSHDYQKSYDGKEHTTHRRRSEDTHQRNRNHRPRRNQSNTKAQQEES